MSDKRVIIAIDDDPLVLKILMSVLKEEYKVLPVTSALQALGFLKTHQVDFIIVDNLMPEMTGIEFIHKIKEEESKKDIPVLLLTGTVNSQLDEELTSFPEVIVLEKPVDAGKLKECIKSKIGEEL